MVFRQRYAVGEQLRRLLQLISMKSVEEMEKPPALPLTEEVREAGERVIGQGRGSVTVVIVAVQVWSKRLSCLIYIEPHDIGTPVCAVARNLPAPLC